MGPGTVGFVGVPAAELFRVERVLDVDEDDAGFIRIFRIHAGVFARRRPAESGNQYAVGEIDLVRAGVGRSGNEFGDAGILRIGDVDDAPARNVVMTTDD